MNTIENYEDYIQSTVQNCVSQMILYKFQC